MIDREVGAIRLLLLVFLASGEEWDGRKDVTALLSRGSYASHRIGCLESVESWRMGMGRGHFNLDQSAGLKYPYQGCWVLNFLQCSHSFVLRVTLANTFTAVIQMPL